MVRDSVWPPRIAERLGRLEGVWSARLGASKTALLQAMMEHLGDGHGKRLRPGLVLFWGDVCGEGLRDVHDTLAAIVEFIHVATLCHDDVLDGSLLRRGHPSMPQRWGNHASVLGGDYVYAVAFQMMADVRRWDVLDVLSSATTQVVEGEVQQLMLQQADVPTSASYVDVVDAKTATLFAVSAQLGALVAGGSDTEVAGARAFGLSVGRAYQVLDDLRDYGWYGGVQGKARGDDVAEGKPTLPLLLALEAAPSETQAAMLAMLRRQDRGVLPDLCALITAYKGLEASEAMLRGFLADARSHAEVLPPPARSEVWAWLERVCPLGSVGS